MLFTYQFIFFPSNTWNQYIQAFWNFIQNIQQDGGMLSVHLRQYMNIKDCLHKQLFKHTFASLVCYFAYWLIHVTLLCFVLWM